MQTELSKHKVFVLRLAVGAILIVNVSHFDLLFSKLFRPAKPTQISIFKSTLYTKEQSNASNDADLQVTGLQQRADRAAVILSMIAAILYQNIKCVGCVLVARVWKKPGVTDAPDRAVLQCRPVRVISERNPTIITALFTLIVNLVLVTKLRGSTSLSHYARRLR